MTGEQFAAPAMEATNEAQGQDVYEAIRVTIEDAEADVERLRRRLAETDHFIHAIEPGDEAYARLIGAVMLTRRILVAVTLSFWIGHSATAEDFTGRKLNDQPTQFIFGYGSLINTSSRNSSIASPVAAIPARIASTFGYLRTWNDRSSSGFTALGLRKAETGETAMTINGVLYPAEGDDMSAFDAREAGYIRVEVPHQDIEAVSWQAIPTEGRIWVYVPEHGLAPNAQYPLLQSYIDVVIEGGLDYGPDFAREIIQTTTGWSEYWLNDRRLARRPWVFDRQYKKEDELLAARAPHFVDRRLPEAFSAHYLGLDAPISAPAK